MTKNEIINEIKNVVMNNGGEVNLGWVTISVINGEVVRTLHDYSKNVKSEKIAQIQIYLDCLNDMEAKTVETKVENTENTVEVEPKATKKDIIMGLHENGSVECDLETAQSIANEGFIEIENYKDGVLKGDVCYDKVMDEMFDEYDCAFTEISHKKCMLSLDDIYTVTKLYDKGYINNLDYDGDNIWHCMVRLTNVLSDFCKRWDSKLSKVA